MGAVDQPVEAALEFALLLPRALTAREQEGACGRVIEHGKRGTIESIVQISRRHGRELGRRDVPGAQHDRGEIEAAENAGAAAVGPAGVPKCQRSYLVDAQSRYVDAENIDAIPLDASDMLERDRNVGDLRAA